MSPKRLTERIDALPRWQRWTLNSSALVSAVLVLVAATRPIWQPVAKSAVVTVLDSTYVTQQSYAADTFRDSLTHKQEIDSVFRMLGDAKRERSQIDSSLRCVTRKVKPDWCE